MVKFVENELQTIKTGISDMWTLVQQQLENAYDALQHADKELAKTVIAKEKRVNAFELKIDSDIEDFIALYNPVAVDLRFALAMLNINNNLERIGDYAESIARFVVGNDMGDRTREMLSDLQLNEMYDLVIYMFSNTFKALQTHDVALAKSIFDKDDRLDEINHAAVDHLTDYATRHPETMRICLEISAIFRKLERAGDHINNLAEEAIYYIDAEVLKHKKNSEPFN